MTGLGNLQVQILHSIAQKAAVHKDRQCNVCQAKAFPNQVSSKPKNAPGLSGVCCLHGKTPAVKPLVWRAPPAYLKEELTYSVEEQCSGHV